MRKFSMVCGAVALGLISSISTAAMNSLANPGFETPQATTGGELPGAAGWSTYGGVFTENVTGRGNLFAHSGTQNIKVYGNGGVYQNFAVTAGQSYDATAYGELSASDAPTAGSAYFGAELLIIFHNAANAQVGATLSSNMVMVTSDKDNYHLGSLSGTVPATVTQLTFQLNQYAPSGGAAFFDDAALSITSAVPEPASLTALAASGLVFGRRRRA